MTDSLPTTVVIPTIGRPSLLTLLEALGAAAEEGPAPAAVVVVDDRPVGEADARPLDLAAVGGRLTAQMVRSGGRGPSAARNAGWRRAATPWVSFLDDDVVPDRDWLRLLAADLEAAGPDVAGIQGQVSVPLPSTRRPTDWERGTAGLATAAWITADITYRRYDLARVGGFDERFPRAFREDADLALRIQQVGGVLSQGKRGITHPVRPVDDWVSVRAQRGNADDVLMNRLHGTDWWDRAAAPRGRLRAHLATTAALGLAVSTALAGRRRVAAAAAVGWVAGLADFVRVRVLPGPRDAAEVRRMVLTSVAIPPLATWHTLRGIWLHRSAPAWRGLPDLVLFDRDGTLVHDVPYNGDASLVVPVPQARGAIEALRAQGVRVGLITNQSGVGSGKISAEQAHSVNAEVERRLGPFDVVVMCSHAADDGCDCRKPAPGMVLEACHRLGTAPERCVVVGDIETDVRAAEAAGARAILVPNAATALADVRSSAVVAADLAEAARLLLRVTD